MVKLMVFSRVGKLLGSPRCLLGASFGALGRSLGALGVLLAALGALLAALGALLAALGAPSWRKLGSKMASEAILFQKREFTKSIGKRNGKPHFLIPR